MAWCLRQMLVAVSVSRQVQAGNLAVWRGHTGEPASSAKRWTNGSPTVAVGPLLRARATIFRIYFRSSDQGSTFIRLNATLAAISANRQNPFAHPICSGVRQSGSKSRELATTITVPRARLVATLKSVRVVEEPHAARRVFRRRTGARVNQHRRFRPLELVDGADTRHFHFSQRA